MKSLLLYPLLFLLLFASITKGQKIDSLKTVLQPKKGRDRIPLLIDLGREYTGVDDRLSATYAKEAYEIAVLCADTISMLDAGRLLGTSLRRAGLADSSLRFHAVVLNLSNKKKYVSQRLKILNGLANVHVHNGDYDKALKYFLEYLRIPESKTDSLGLSIVFNNVGMVYYKLTNNDKALWYYLRSLEIRETIASSFDLDQLYINTALCHVASKNVVKVDHFVQLALESCGKNCKDMITVQANYARGAVRHAAKDYDDSEKYIQESFRVANRVSSVQFQLDNIILLAQIYSSRKQFGLALDLLFKGVRLLELQPTYKLERLKIYRQLYETYSIVNNFKLTALYQQKFIELTDSLYGYRRINNLMQSEAEFLERDNTAKLESQEQILLLQEQVINRQMLLTVSISCLVLVLVCLIVLLVRSNAMKKKINQILDERVKERTSQLESSYQEMAKTSEQMHLSLRHTSQNIRDAAARINALCQLATEDTDAVQRKASLQMISKIVGEMMLPDSK